MNLINPFRNNPVSLGISNDADRDRSHSASRNLIVRTNSFIHTIRPFYAKVDIALTVNNQL